MSTQTLWHIKWLHFDVNVHALRGYYAHYHFNSISRQTSPTFRLFNLTFPLFRLTPVYQLPSYCVGKKKAFDETPIPIAHQGTMARLCNGLKWLESEMIKPTQTANRAGSWWAVKSLASGVLYLFSVVSRSAVTCIHVEFRNNGERGQKVGPETWFKCLADSWRASQALASWLCCMSYISPAPSLAMEFVEQINK